MFQIQDAQIEKIIVHRFSQEIIHEKISESSIEIEDEVDKEVIKHLFMKPFMKPQSSYHFSHEVDLDFNVLYKSSQDYFDGDLDFVSYSKNIFEHLKEVSQHPNIKDGDFFVIHFKNVLVNSYEKDAIGIYKVEQTEHFLSTKWTSPEEAMVALEEGIHAGKLDKACFIINIAPEPEVYIVDQNKQESVYWKQDFIKVTLKNDHYNQTVQTMEMTQHFIQDQFPHEFEVERVDQIDLLNRSMDYFKAAEQYNQSEFEEVVLQDESLIGSFRNYQDNVYESQGWEFEDDFSMVPDAVKKNQRFYKSVIKLDKNFHIYVHGNREMIEQGVDENGRKFYKLYFDEEH